MNSCEYAGDCAGGAEQEEQSTELQSCRGAGEEVAGAELQR